MNCNSNKRDCELYDEPDDDTDIEGQLRYMKSEYFGDVSQRAAQESGCGLFWRYEPDAFVLMK